MKYQVKPAKVAKDTMKTSTSDGKKSWAVDAFTKAFLSQKPKQKPKKYQVKSSKSGSAIRLWMVSPTNPRFPIKMGFDPRLPKLLMLDDHLPHDMFLPTNFCSFPGHAWCRSSQPWSSFQLERPAYQLLNQGYTEPQGFINHAVNPIKVNKPSSPLVDYWVYS